ncbi:hypothetical protein CVT24_009532 [Panaeolus cyanescens]|uniref:Transcription activator GCR1-like domain-containing protein n=1 Tax=Panaeolus cyanescens TaxID=181874 RepID=A0A409WRU1_9AGAR|nr:hypothetical protein CVT24_009532 [Panaeolus cyanescens]
MLVDQAHRERDGTGYNGKLWRFIPAHPITATKVIHFLDHEFTRKKKLAGGKSIPNTSVGASSIRQTINALERHRFRHQSDPEYQAVPESQIPLRQNFTIHELERLARAREPKRLKTTQELKASGVASKTYTENDLINMSKDLLYSPNGNTKSSITYSLCDRGMLLVANHMALRGEDAREMLLSDIRLRDVPLVDIGLDHKVIALIVDSLDSKANTEGNFEEFAAFRHRNPDLCSIGALGLFLFARWHVLQKPLPDFAPVYDDSDGESDDEDENNYDNEENEDNEEGEEGPDGRDQNDVNNEAIKTHRAGIGYRTWYDVVLFPSSISETKIMSPENHRERFNAQKKRLNLGHKQVTHVGRTFGATTAIERGASVDSVRILGRWAQSAGSFDVYNRALPTDAMIAAAGFNGRQQDSYYILRDSLDPPEQLINSIFPWIEHEELALATRLETDGLRAKDQTLVHLLRLLRALRRVILQDTAVQYQMYSDAPIFQYHPFNTSIFHEFSLSSVIALQRTEDEVKRHLASAPERLTIGIQGALSTSLLRIDDLCRKVDTAHALLTQSFATLQNTVRASLLVLAKSAKSSRKQKQIDLLIDNLDDLVPADLLLIANNLPPDSKADSPEHLRPSKSIRLHDHSTGSPQHTVRTQNTPHSIEASSRPHHKEGVAIQASSNPPNPPPLANYIQLPTLQPAQSISLPNHQVLSKPPIVSGNGNIYWHSMFPIPETDSTLQAVQIKALTALEKHIDQDQLQKHRFEWVDNEWLPDFDSFWSPHVGASPSLEEIWKEHNKGIQGRLSIKQLREHWGTRWRRKRGGVKTEEGRRRKVVNLIEKLIAQPGWTEETAFKFMREKYPLSSKSSSIHLKSTRAFIQHYLQRTDIQAEKEILEIAQGYEID